MKIILLTLFIAIFLTACNNFRTTVKIDRVMPEITDDVPLYVYYDDFNTPPDSAVYIGTFACQVIGGEGSKFELLSSIDSKVKENGGNLILLEKPENYSFKGKIYLAKEFPTTGYTIDSLKSIWKQRKPDKLEGIYRDFLSDVSYRNHNYFGTYGIVKTDSNDYLMIYLSGYDSKEFLYALNELDRIWSRGDIIAYIKKTNKSTVYKTKKFETNKYLNDNSMLKIDDGNLRFLTKNDISHYWKIYPDTSKFETPIGSLTGFAISKNRILTCNHAFLTEHEKVYVRGINGNFDVKYPAIVEKQDRTNDVAIIRLKDTTISNEFTPFPVSEEIKSTAEGVFVLGYPILMIAGEEIKLTDGLISSTSGIGGDENTYQISAPVQPGNSGSPLFDKNGNLIGIVNSKITKADNIGYALKYKEIKDFYTNNGFNPDIKAENAYKDLSYSDKVKALQKSIYIIEINDSRPIDDIIEELEK